ncbi:MAG TPA: PEP-CTERM sorting domain-containing protein [Fimbriimonas sp.]|nr:PEP-CTERM sorting domain-containing protein [Fimbriimonas sp.]
MKKTLGILSFGLLAGSAYSQFAITMDGTRDANYGGGGQGNVQTSPTGFGNSTTGTVGNANGSELDNGIGEWGNDGYFYIFLGGNLETNFNKLELFIDAQAGGQNVLRGDNPNVDFNGLNRMAGLTFDSTFEPEFWFSITGNGTDLFANAAELLTSGGGQGNYLGQGTYGSNGALTGGGAFGAGIIATINNSNIGGVDGSSATGAGAVNTGIEIGIPLALLGNPTWGNGVKVSAFINGGGHDFVSNQVLGGVPAGTGNLGDPSFVNFNNQTGNQYFVVPEPASMIALTLGAFGLIARKRKQK